MLLNLQETHLTNNAQIPKVWLNYNHIYEIISTHAQEEDRFAGMIIFVNKAFELVDTEEI